MAHPQHIFASSNSDNQPRGVKWLVVFSLPFVGICAFMLWLMAGIVMEWKQASQWQETPAHILRSQLVVSDKDPAMKNSPKLYANEVRYSYQFNGQSYESRRASLWQERDSQRKPRKRLHKQLSKHIEQNTPSRCYVNPANPGEAVLVRDLNIELLKAYALFLLLYGIPGWGAIILLWFVWPRIELMGQILKKTFGNDARKISADTELVLLGLIIGAITWSFLTLPVIFWTYNNISNYGDYAALNQFMIPAPSLLFLVGAIYQLWHWRRFGNPKLQLDTLPVLGSELRGTITVPVPLKNNEINVRLECSKRIHFSSASTRHAERTILWENALRVRPISAAKQTTIPVRMSIPGDMPASEDLGDGDAILWELHASAKLGVGFSATFPLVVKAKSADA